MPTAIVRLFRVEMGYGFIPPDEGSARGNCRRAAW
jgi:cold shock CspA family protein